MMFGPFNWSSHDFGYKNSLIFGEDFFFFWSSLKFGDKNFSIFDEDLFFGLHLICLREKNRGRTSSPKVESRAKFG